MGEGGAALVLAAFLQAVDAPPPADDAELLPPRMKSRDQAAISRCYDFGARRMGAEGRTVVAVRIGPDGSVGDMKFDAGILPWQEKTARCVISHLSFQPATRNGVPVASEAEVPVAFSLDSGTGRSAELSMPKLISTPAEAEDANRACYPADELTTGTPKYRVSFSSRGKMTKIELVESSGLDSLDRAGHCVLERLRFEPATRDKQPVSSTVTVPIFLRPPN